MALQAKIFYTKLIIWLDMECKLEAFLPQTGKGMSPFISIIYFLVINIAKSKALSK